MTTLIDRVGEYEAALAKPALPLEGSPGGIPQPAPVSRRPDPHAARLRASAEAERKRQEAWAMRQGDRFCCETDA